MTVSLVTGATGFIGHRLVRSLLERGDTVRGLVRDPAKAEDLGGLGAELVQGDVTDDESIARAVQGVDRVFHTAGLVGEWLDRDEARRVNVEGTRRVFSHAADAGAERGIHVSSMSVLGTIHHHGTDESAPYVYGDPYTDTKIDSEQAARDVAAGKGLELVVIRPGFVYGPRDRQILLPVVERMLEGKFAFAGDGGKEMNTVYVDDVSQAALLADQTPAAAGQVYNITDGQNTTMREFVTFIAEHLGIPPPTRKAPVPVIKYGSVVMESLWRAAGAKKPPLLNKSRARFLYYNQNFSIEKARQELGYEPRVSYREGLPKALDWLRENGLVPSREDALAHAG